MQRTMPLILLAFLCCCQETGQPAPAAAGGAAPEASARAVADWDGRPQGSDWTAMLEAALDQKGAALIAVNPADAVEFCPGFAALDAGGRRDFYIGLVSRMARFESNFNPETSFTESFPDSQGNPVISRGLLQLSFERANAYPGCSLESPGQLHDRRQTSAARSPCSTGWSAGTR